MFRAFVLVRNLASSVQHLDFRKFTFEHVGLRFRELREVFSSLDVNPDDWVLEKGYVHLPPGSPGSPVGGIPNDIEDILLLFRLYKVGDISFSRLAIIQPGGNKLVQLPYRSMNELNSYSPLPLELEPNECQAWTAFATGIRASRSWTSNWFTAARRFFLSGGAKQFNPRWDDVDRIVDYTTALEAALVPEHDFLKRRMSMRVAALVAPDDASEQQAITKLFKQLYDVRSIVVHGSKLSDENREWLLENCDQIERRVRQALVAALRMLPIDESGRRTALAKVYDPGEDVHGEHALQIFREIKTDAVRKAIATKIAGLAGL